MTKLIVVPIMKDGIPDTGVEATIKIRDADSKALLVDGETMEEIGDGWYKYQMLNYDPEKNYVIRVDVINADSDILFYFASNISFVDDIRYVIKGPTAGFNQ